MCGKKREIEFNVRGFDSSTGLRIAFVGIYEVCISVSPLWRGYLRGLYLTFGRGRGRYTRFVSHLPIYNSIYEVCISVPLTPSAAIYEVLISPRTERWGRSKRFCSLHMRGLYLTIDEVCIFARRGEGQDRDTNLVNGVGPEQAAAHTRCDLIP